MFVKRMKRITRIYDYGWKYNCSCPQCKKIYNIKSEDLIVTSDSDWGGKRFYYFKVKCSNCKKLTIVVPKDDIPYEVKENVLAETTPIIESEFNR